MRPSDLPPPKYAMDGDGKYWEGKYSNARNMNIDTEVTRITAEIERYKALEHDAHAKHVALKRTLGKLQTQSKHVDKLLSTTKVDETHDGHN